MNFVNFDLSKKLKEKGFTCRYPIAMYNELGSFYALYTSADHNPNIKSVFGNREYYDYNDFDDKDYVCPTISQVLKWLREEKKLHIIIPASFDEGYWWEIRDFNREISEYSDIEYTSYEKAALAGINYVLNNLILL